MEANVQGESVGVFETDVIGHVLADFSRCGGRVQMDADHSTVRYCHSPLYGLLGLGSLSVWGQKNKNSAEQNAK